MARVAQLYEQVKKGRDVRANLIALRENISDESLRRSFQAMLDGDYTVLADLLEAEDPKVRRNAALILGRTGDSAVMPYLVRAWEKEETLYIREDYLKAMSLLDYRDIAETEGADTGVGEASAGLREWRTECIG